MISMATRTRRLAGPAIARFRHAPNRQHEAKKLLAVFGSAGQHRSMILRRQLGCLAFVLLLIANSLAESDPTDDKKNIPNIPNFVWLGKAYSEGGVTLYVGQSKTAVICDHLGVLNASGKPVRLKIAYISYENDAKKNSFETDLIPSSVDRIVMVRVPGIKTNPGPADETVGFKELWVNDREAEKPPDHF